MERNGKNAHNKLLCVSIFIQQCCVGSVCLCGVWLSVGKTLKVFRKKKH